MIHYLDFEFSLLSLFYLLNLCFNMQVFGKLTQICEVFKELNECGHPKYQKWMFQQVFSDPAQACETVNMLHRQMLLEVDNAI